MKIKITILFLFCSLFFAQNSFSSRCNFFSKDNAIENPQNGTSDYDDNWLKERFNPTVQEPIGKYRQGMIEGVPDVNPLTVEEYNKQHNVYSNPYGTDYDLERKAESYNLHNNKVLPKESTFNYWGIGFGILILILLLMR